MVDISIDKLLEDTEKNKFILVNAAALRAKQISAGSLPYIDEFDPTNPIITALRELSLKKIKYREVEAEVLDKKQKEKAKEKGQKSESVLDRLAKGAKRKYTKKS